MSDDLEKINTPRGDGARSMSNLSTDAMYTNSAPGEGADWFGPRQPLRPIAPPEVTGRQWDFVPGYNLVTTPRAYEDIDFAALRALASAYDPVRLIIERRKDQMCRLPWTIRIKHDDASGKKRPKPSQLSVAQRSRIADITAFFKRPDGELTFRSWLRGLLEDLLVLDAPALFCERDPAGNLIGLPYIDGATIKRIIDDHGRTPRPFRWDGRPFDWLGQTVTPANIHDLGFKITNGLLFPVAYQQILKGLPAVNMTTWDCIYRPYNLRTDRAYGFSPVAQIVATVSTAMRRSFSQFEYFREGNQPESIYGLPEDWTPDQVQRFQDYWDNLFVGNLGNRRRMKFLPGGANNAYTALKEPPLKNEFDEWLVRVCCFAFSYPPAAFVSLSNRSIAEQHERTAEEEGIEPLKNWFSDLANEIIEREFSEEIEFAWAEESEVDQKVEAEILNSYVANGVLSINEARQRIGEEPNVDPAAGLLMCKTATGFVPIGTVKPQAGADDGEDDEDDDLDDDAEKLRKRVTSIMVPPPDWQPCARFKLAGMTFFPDLKKKQIRTVDAGAILALESAGWTRKRITITLKEK